MTLALCRRGEQAFDGVDRKSTRLNSSHVAISYAVFCLKKKKKQFIDRVLVLGDGAWRSDEHHRRRSRRRDRRRPRGGTAQDGESCGVTVIADSSSGR